MCIDGNPGGHTNMLECNVNGPRRMLDGNAPNDESFGDVDVLLAVLQAPLPPTPTLEVAPQPAKVCSGTMLCPLLPLSENFTF